MTTRAGGAIRGAPNPSGRWDFDRLVAVLDPDVVLRADLGPLPAGSREPSRSEIDGCSRSWASRSRAGRSSRWSILADPERLSRLDPILDEG
jgi:hypothetical protein